MLLHVQESRLRDCGEPVLSILSRDSRGRGGFLGRRHFLGIALLPELFEELLLADVVMIAQQVEQGIVDLVSVVG